MTVELFTEEGHFPNNGSFSRRRAIFVAHFAAHFVAAKWGVGLQNGTHVPNGGFTAAKPPAKWVFGCENWSFKALGISQPISQLRKERGGYEMALVCQGVVSHLRKFSQRGAWGCEIISQLSGDFAVATSGL